MTTMILVVVVDLHGGFHFRFVECANEVAKTNLEACSFDAPVIHVHAPGNLQACQLGMHTHKGHPAKGRKDIRRRKNSEVEASEDSSRVESSQVGQGTAEQVGRVRTRRNRIFWLVKDT